MRVRIITDSPSDVPQSYLEKYDIRVIPVYINFGTESYLDNEASLPRAAFYERVSQGGVMPTTAASSPGDAEKIMREALEDGDHVVAIHITQTLSSVIQSSRIAAQNIGSDRVTVLDTESLSLGSGWLAILAAEKAAAGANVDEIVATVNAGKERRDLWAGIDTLDFLRRSVRVSWVRAGVGALLNIKPIIRVENGEVQQATRVRSFKNVFKQLVTYGQEVAPLERLALLHTSNPDGAEQLKEALAEIAPPDHTIIVDVSASIGTHLGPGSLGIATVRKAN